MTWKKNQEAKEKSAIRRTLERNKKKLLATKDEKKNTLNNFAIHLNITNVSDVC